MLNEVIFEPRQNDLDVRSRLCKQWHYPTISYHSTRFYYFLRWFQFLRVKCKYKPFRIPHKTHFLPKLVMSDCTFKLVGIKSKMASLIIGNYSGCCSKLGRQAPPTARCRRQSGRALPAARTARSAHCSMARSLQRDISQVPHHRS